MAGPRSGSEIGNNAGPLGRSRECKGFDVADFKLGFGFYHHMLADDTLRFARQCGATHAVAHLVDYFGSGTSKTVNQPVGNRNGWGAAGGSDERWTLPALKALRTRFEDAGLTLAAIENFDPAHWHDVLLGGPRRDEQIEAIQRIIRNLGDAGIPVMGYNFSLAGVAGRVTGPFARGGATSVGMEGSDDSPIPNGTVWNMVYDADAPAGTQPRIDHDELWSRLEYFLKAVLPVAEDAGVRLAAHPDDPPVAVLRQTPRLVYQPDMYQQLTDIHRSPSNALEFCLGSVAEMTEGDIYETTRKHAQAGDIAYIHFRNVVGKVPHYRETFVDDGEIDMARIVVILQEAGFDGVIIPDHTPLMSCDAPWHSGMSFAMGYMRALQKLL